MIAKFQNIKDDRPWGYFRQFCENTPATVKIIVVKPNERLSLQSHEKREEFWLVISGSGIAEVGDELRKIKIDDEIIIPLKTKHRLTAGASGIKIMEISYGEFSEDDITRYEDKYGRV